MAMAYDIKLPSIMVTETAKQIIAEVFTQQQVEILILRLLADLAYQNKE